MPYDQEELAALVRQVVTRTVGQATKRPIVHEEAIRQLANGATFVVPVGALVTPLARQLALERHIQLVSEDPAAPDFEPAAVQAAGRPGTKAVALGADHGGYALKEKLKAVVNAAGYDIIDCGTHSTEAVDYPDYAYAVARQVADGRAWRGILVDGAGIGSCMAANKVPGIRAAMCYDQATAVNSREHNNANVLTLGAGLIGDNLAGQIVRTWLLTEFGGGRHTRRVEKIDAIGHRFMKKVAD
jgi:ribose 5-phosphate isomerase B